MRSWLPNRGRGRGELQRLRAQCQNVLDTLHIPRPFDLQAFLDSLAEQRQRPIRLEPWPASGTAQAPCGVWFATERADYICYDPDTSPLHREQIIFHECAHILFAHRLDFDLPEATRLLPDVGPSLIRRILARTTYTSDQEREAEMLASLIALRAAQQPWRPSGIDHLDDCLGRPLTGGQT